VTLTLQEWPTAAGPVPSAGLSSTRFVAAWWTLAVAVVALFGVAFGLVLSGAQEHSSQKRLYSQFRQELAEATAPVSGPVTPGQPVALLTSKRLGLSAVVVEGTAGRDLRKGPGHRRDTVLPGQYGVSVLYGRSVTYGRPFAALASLRPEDVITVVTGQGTFTYRVDRVRRPGDPLPAPVAKGQSRLVLASLNASGWRSGWAPQRAVYVDASLVGTAQQPNPALVPVPASEQLEGIDRSSTVMVVLWLQLLLLALLATVWAARRWGSLQAWIAGAPAVLALLWAATDAGLALLPNVL